MELSSDAIFLLGAGASQEAGIKTSYDLTQAIRDEIVGSRRNARAVAALNFVSAALLLDDAANDGADPFGGLDVERVFAAVQLLATRRELEVTPFVSAWHPSVDDLDRGSDPTGFERQLSEGLIGDRNGRTRTGAALRAVQQLIDVRTGRAHGRTYAGLQGLMVTHLRRLLSTTEESVDYLRPLIDLGRRPGGVTVATLNYDLSIEQAAANAGVPCTSGLEEWLETGSWPTPDKGIRLLKLHGSIDWIWQDIRQTGHLGRRVVQKAQPPYDSGPPALIFGQGAKLRAEGPFLELFAQLDRALRTAPQLVCIGYSFRDEHVNELIRRWTSSPGADQLSAVDPFWPEPTPFYQQRRTFRDELTLAYGQEAPRTEQERAKISFEVIRETCGAALSQMV